MVEVHWAVDHCKDAEHQTEAAGRVGTAEGAREVGSDGGDCQLQTVGDFLIGLVAEDQVDNPRLLRCEGESLGDFFPGRSGHGEWKHVF